MNVEVALLADCFDGPLLGTLMRDAEPCGLDRCERAHSVTSSLSSITPGLSASLKQKRAPIRHIATKAALNDGHEPVYHIQTLAPSTPPKEPAVSSQA